jgi:plastocyanin
VRIRRTLDRRYVFGIMLVALALGMCLTIPTRTQAAGAPLVIRAGDGEPGYAINAFLPASFTVPVGATVRWQFPWFEPHSVTFGQAQSGAPPSTPSPATYDGSGFVTSDLTFGPAKSYDVVFTKPGAYAYRCVIHPSMSGTVMVVGPGQAADTQETLDSRSAREFQTALADLKAIAGDWAARPSTVTTLPDGSAEHDVTIAGATTFGDVQQYFPANITVAAGDSVHWRSLVYTPHTVTLGDFPSGPISPDNPLVAARAQPAESYDGTGFWNSGVIGIDWAAGLDFTVRFSKPGTYSYYCVLHRSQGQVGMVTVLAATSPSPTPTVVAPGPPDTGTGSAARHAPAIAVLALGALLAGAGGVGAALTRRRRA